MKRLNSNYSLSVSIIQINHCDRKISPIVIKFFKKCVILVDKGGSFLGADIAKYFDSTDNKYREATLPTFIDFCFDEQIITLKPETIKRCNLKLLASKLYKQLQSIAEAKGRTLKRYPRPIPNYKEPQIHAKSGLYVSGLIINPSYWEKQKFKDT